MGEGPTPTLSAERARLERDLAMFLSLANHDLQAPLRTLRSFVELAAEEHPSPFLDEAIALASRLQGLVRAALTYGRLPDHRLDLQPVPLAEAIAAGLDRVGLELEDRHAVVEVAEDLPWVMADRVLLALALEAVLDNATRYVDPRQVPELKIDAVTDGRYIRLRVADNGVGVPPAERSRLFEPMARSRGGGGGGIPGFGFGLAVVRRACHLQHGRCGMDDTPDGTGARVWLELPRAPDDPDARPGDEAMPERR